LVQLPRNCAYSTMQQLAMTSIQIDEYTRECLPMCVRQRSNSIDVIDVLTDLCIVRRVPGFITSDNGPEFVAQVERDGIQAVGAKATHNRPGSPKENGYCKSRNTRLRNELLNGEIFHGRKEVQIITEQWRRHYNTKRSHSSLGYRPPASEFVVPMERRSSIH